MINLLNVVEDKQFRNFQTRYKNSPVASSLANTNKVETWDDLMLVEVASTRADSTTRDLENSYRGSRLGFHGRIQKR